MVKKLLISAVVFSMIIVFVSACGNQNAPEGYEIAVVAKITGIPWFNRMEEGVRQAADDLNVNAYQIGPANADPAQQVKMVEDLISKGVDAICVVPNDAKSLEPAFRRAKERGIIILTHESPDQTGKDYDIELIDNIKFAQHHVDMIVRFMGESGGYAILVGSLTVPLHNLWADEAVRYAKEKYPGLTLVTNRIPCAEDQELSKQKTLELIIAYPDLKGIIAFGSLGPPGAAQALREKGLTDKIAVVGAVIPAHGASYLKDGSLKHGILWDPKDAGYALTWVAKVLLDGGDITEANEVPGIGAISLKEDVIEVNAMIDITKDNVDSFGF